MRYFALATVSAVALMAADASAFHKPNHKPAFPGAPSGQFFLAPILAGETCTADITEPEGQVAVAHGGPKKFGFIGANNIELIVVSEDPDVVEFCFVEGVGPFPADVNVRVSFDEEVVE